MKWNNQSQNMEKLPKWLPSELKSHAENLVRIGGLGEMESCLSRLLTCPDMEKVWKTLGRQAESGQQLIDYFDYVRQQVALLIGFPNVLAIPGNAVQRRAFVKIAKALNDALDVLKSLGDCQNPDDGWRLLEAAIQRSELDCINQDASKLLEIHELKTRLQSIQQYSTIPDVLEIFLCVAMCASNAPDAALPKKRNDKRAKVVYFVDLVSKYVQSSFGQPLHEVVAATVNTALDLHDDAISADYVRKLKRT